MIDAAALFSAHQPTLLHWFGGRVGPDEAPDLAQITYLRVLRGAATYREQGQPQAWLFKIARHVLVDEHRARTRQPDVAGSYEETLGAGHVWDAGGAAHLRRLELGAAIRALPPRQRSVVVHRYLLGTSRAQTAERLGVTDNAVMKLQARAIANLRRALEER